MTGCPQQHFGTDRLCLIHQASQTERPGWRKQPLWCITPAESLASNWNNLWSRLCPAFSASHTCVCLMPGLALCGHNHCDGTVLAVAAVALVSSQWNTIRDCHNHAFYFHNYVFIEWCWWHFAAFFRYHYFHCHTIAVSRVTGVWQCMLPTCHNFPMQFAANS